VADVRTVLAALGIVLYAVLRIAYSVFYNHFGLTPDDLGLGYLDLLVQSAVGTVILVMAAFAVAALVVPVYVGLSEGAWVQWRNLRGRRPAGPSVPEHSPSGNGEGESAPGSDGRPSRMVSAGRNLGSLALLALVIAGIVTGRPLLVLAVFLVFVARALPAGIKRIKSGWTGEHHAWWRGGLAAIASLIAGLAIFSLLARAELDAARVQHGHASRFTVLGFQITTWGAEDATVSWTGTQVVAELRPLAGRCLMYLGQSNGTAFVYLASTDEVFRIPAAAVVVRTRPAACNHS
jgi:hypothetical protein